MFQFISYESSHGFSELGRLALPRGQAILLFPGGAREACHGATEKWPDGRWYRGIIGAW